MFLLKERFMVEKTRKDWCKLVLLEVVYKTFLLCNGN